VITVSLLHPTQAVPTQSWTFTNETTVRIGRATDNDVVLYSAVVSRYHVELRKSSAGWRVVNISTNGIYGTDGQPLSKVAVTDGMVFRLATSGPRMKVNLGGPPPAALDRVEIEEDSTSEDLTALDGSFP
jgi:pSer/pThr/pTyr-binding forkhead associated (FHA) protein